MRVCYFGTYRDEYSRNRILLAGLRKNGVEVLECHERLWDSIEDRVNTVSGGWKSPRFWLRVGSVYARLLRRYARLGQDYDVLVVGYPGQLDVLLARLLASLNGKPLAWDIFMSIYLVALERGLDQRSGVGVALLRKLEWLACRAPDQLLLDTRSYAAWFERTHGVDAASIALVPTGADDSIFSPLPRTRPADDAFEVLYYGTYIPNHGVGTIIEAAALLVDDAKLRFVMIGDGPDRPAAEALAKERGLENVRFVDWMEPRLLRQHIANADLCLGVFGTTPQSLMTVQNKIYECLAMRRPVLTGHGPAIAEAFTHEQHLYLCERDNPEALARALRALRSDAALCTQMAEQGHARFVTEYALGPLGKRAADLLARLLPRGEDLSHAAP